MAWTENGLLATHDGTNGSSWDTASIAPAADRLLVVIMQTVENNAADEHLHTVTGLGGGTSLTFSKLVDSFWSSNTDTDCDVRTSVHIAYTGATTPTAGTLTLSTTVSVAAIQVHYIVTEFGGSNAANEATLADVIPQQKESIDNTGDYTETATLDSAVTSGNAVFGIYAVRDASVSAITPEGGWTAEVGEDIFNNHGLHCSWYSGDDDNSFTCGSTGGAIDGEAAWIFEMAAYVAPFIPGKKQNAYFTQAVQRASLF